MLVSTSAFAGDCPLRAQGDSLYSLNRQSSFVIRRSLVLLPRRDEQPGPLACQPTPAACARARGGTRRLSSHSTICALGEAEPVAKLLAGDTPRASVPRIRHEHSASAGGRTRAIREHARGRGQIRQHQRQALRPRARHPRRAGLRDHRDGTRRFRRRPSDRRAAAASPASCTIATDARDVDGARRCGPRRSRDRRPPSRGRADPPALEVERRSKQSPSGDDPTRPAAEEENSCDFDRRAASTARRRRWSSAAGGLSTTRSRTSSRRAGGFRA